LLYDRPTIKKLYGLLVETKYRPEIDGLRAIAVLSVILYHAEFLIGQTKFLPGGFLGVDVFFVISGFLITSLIVAEFDKTGTISITSFYQRRARRLLPALLLVILATLPFSWMLLLPEQLLDYAKSLVSSLFFGSNFYWNLSLQQYGAESSLLKPLLHTWSLAVEEQFYIIYPLMLLAILKWRASQMALILSTGLLASLVLAETTPPEGASFSFYMLPTRFWELLAGGLLATVIHLKPSRQNLLFKFMPLLGVCLIGQATVLVDVNNSKHPGLVTLFPVVGTVLIIWFSNKDEIVTRILSSRIFVGTGLVSYSLYLWHYPIFAFGRIHSSSVDLTDKLGWIGITLVASLTSYYLVEKPFRNSRKVKNSIFWPVLVMAFLLSLSVSVYFIASDGASSRFDGVDAYSEFKEPEYRRLESGSGAMWVWGKDKQSPRCFNRKAKDACRFGDELFITLGDSYVAHFEYSLLQKLNQEEHGLISLTAGICPFITQDMIFAPSGALCPEVNKERWKVLNELENKHIIFMGAKLSYFGDVAGGDWEKSDAIEDYLSSIELMLDKGHKVVLLTGAPGSKKSIVRNWKREALRRDITAPFDPVFHPDDELYTKWESLHAPQFALTHENLIHIRVADFLCPETADRKCLVIGEQGSLYNVGNHLSSIGANIVLDHTFSEMKKRNWID
jgi:peptidoglycan/LPS O-acetylase OafA/YrhL